MEGYYHRGCKAQVRAGLWQGNGGGAQQDEFPCVLGEIHSHCLRLSLPLASLSLSLSLSSSLPRVSLSLSSALSLSICLSTLR